MNAIRAVFSDHGADNCWVSAERFADCCTSATEQASHPDGMRLLLSKLWRHRNSHLPVVAMSHRPWTQGGDFYSCIWKSQRSSVADLWTQGLLRTPADSVRSSDGLLTLGSVCAAALYFATRADNFGTCAPGLLCDGAPGSASRLHAGLQDGLYGPLIGGVC